MRRSAPVLMCRIDETAVQMLTPNDLISQRGIENSKTLIAEFPVCTQNDDHEHIIINSVSWRLVAGFSVDRLFGRLFGRVLGRIFRMEGLERRHRYDLG